MLTEEQESAYLENIINRVKAAEAMLATITVDLEKFRTGSGLTNVQPGQPEIPPAGTETPPPPAAEVVAPVPPVPPVPPSAVPANIPPMPPAPAQPVPPLPSVNPPMPAQPAAGLTPGLGPVPQPGGAPLTVGPPAAQASPGLGPVPGQGPVVGPGPANQPVLTEATSPGGLTRESLIRELSDIGAKLPRETASASMVQLLAAFSVARVSDLEVPQYDAVLNAARQMLAQSTH